MTLFAQIMAEGYSDSYSRVTNFIRHGPYGLPFSRLNLLILAALIEKLCLKQIWKTLLPGEALFQRTKKPAEERAKSILGE